MNRSEYQFLPGLAASKAALFVLFCSLALTTRADVSKQATWTTASGGNGHTYRVVESTGLISWDVANVAAQAAGGYLATITSAAENDFVFALIDDPTYWTQSSNDHGPWIGGYQLPAAAEPAGFTWVLASGGATPEPFAYTNWETGEPNNLTVTVNGTNYNQDRVAFFHTGTGRAATWSDEYNQTGASLNQWTKSYIIELSPIAPIILSSLILPDGTFQLSFTNTPGVPFFVQAATNLASTNWTVISGAVESSSGHYQYIDPQTTNTLRRFYRVRSP